MDETIKLPDLIEELREVFGQFGEVIDVVAKKNYWARGQAFIVFSSVEEASDALESLNGFDIHEKPMQVAYAKTRSDATVKREDNEEGFEQHKAQRLAEKGEVQRMDLPSTLLMDFSERKQAQRHADANAKSGKRAAPEVVVEQRPAKTAKPTGAAAADDFLPPNKILLLRDLPDDYGKPELTAVFQRYPGFREIRTVPGRKGLAFAEYEDEAAATTVKDAMNGITLGDKSIRVTYQRQ